MEIKLNEHHEYEVDGIKRPAVTNILKAVGFIDTTWYTMDGATRGKYVHLACHLDDIGELDEAELDPVLLPYLEAYRLFKNEQGYQVIESEVYHYNPTYGYCGTPDKDGLLNGKPTIIDLKTGKFQDWTALQLALYAMFYESPRDRLGVELKDNGTYILHPFKDRKDYNTALSAVHCYMWQINHGRKEI